MPSPGIRKFCTPHPHNMHSEHIQELEVNVWAQQHGILSLMPTLLAQEFVSLELILSITEDDMKEMEIALIGERWSLTFAIQKTKAAYDLGIASSILPPPSPLTITSHPSTSSSILPPPSPLTIIPTRAAQQCCKFCHKVLTSGKHMCSEEDACPGSTICGWLNLHSTEKKQLCAKKKEERQKVKKQCKEEDDAHKHERDALLHLQPAPEWDGWWEDEVAALAAAQPHLYSVDKDSRKYYNTIKAVAAQFTKSWHLFKKAKAINTKVIVELKVMNLSCTEELEFIKK